LLSAENFYAQWKYFFLLSLRNIKMFLSCLVNEVRQKWLLCSQNTNITAWMFENRRQYGKDRAEFSETPKLCEVIRGPEAIREKEVCFLFWKRTRERLRIAVHARNETSLPSLNVYGTCRQVSLYAESEEQEKTRFWMSHRTSKRDCSLL